MRLLAIDTSAAHCSAALLVDGALTQRLAPASRRHGELILGMMDELLGAAGLHAADLDAFAFAHGPGSFTGLRIAAAVVQGAALAAEKPVVGVSTLAALAQGCHRAGGASRVLCALDARMGEVYAGAYAVDAPDSLARALSPDRVCAPSAVVAPGPGPWAAAGSGWAVYADALRAACGCEPVSLEPERPCEAQDVAILAAAAFAAGDILDPADAVPVYLRDRVTSTG
ncbi:MAG: tRNA (adenosine(37)-N6)-threonylcarbamoyltransferase complex dimerization subunit type 1 TsaB [Thiohalocapsa sp.]|jgi:tRNA threonylcarbamoyladenosine biosynthesis protein TsaB